MTPIRQEHGLYTYPTVIRMAYYRFEAPVVGSLWYTISPFAPLLYTGASAALLCVLSCAYADPDDGIWSSSSSSRMPSSGTALVWRENEGSASRTLGPHAWTIEVFVTIIHSSIIHGANLRAVFCLHIILPWIQALRAHGRHLCRIRPLLDRKRHVWPQLFRAQSQATSSGCGVTYRRSDDLLDGRRDEHAHFFVYEPVLGGTPNDMLPRRTRAVPTR
jgi:hypothetical protein